ncbi:hypothetical protein [Nocardia blacklockiae]|uniref:hypothetical protein n=1 Tax=Nocardia blacklockiae TaxID=480036 RepID=UPI001E437904|nr:hypothetical protein [Nocardia blacklockiae]
MSEMDWAAWQHPSNPALSALNPDLGDRLLALDCDLMWATGWGENANHVLVPVLGLPVLPVITLPEYPGGDHYEDELHWKTRTLVATAASRPFIWVDDEIRQQDRTWVVDNHPAPALLHRIDGASGLLDVDFTTTTDWMRASP